MAKMGQNESKSPQRSAGVSVSARPALSTLRDALQPQR